MSTLFVNTITPNSGDTVTVSGSLTTTGKLTIGDQTSDTVSFVSEISSSLIPDADDTYDLGSSAKQWRNLHIDGTANIDSASINSASIGVVMSDLIPTKSGFMDLGSTQNKWNNIYWNGFAYGQIVSLSGQLTVGTRADIPTASINVVSSSLIPNSGHHHGNWLFDLGASGKEWKNLYVNGISTLSASVFIPTLTVSSSLTAANLTGFSSISGSGVVSASNIHVKTDMAVGDDLTVGDLLEAGRANINGALTVTGTSSFNNTVIYGTGSTISGSLIPSVGATHTLGTMANSWASAHIHGLAHIHTASIEQLNLTHNQDHSSVDASHMVTGGKKFTVKNQLQASISDGATSPLFTVANNNISGGYSTVVGNLSTAGGLLGGLSMSKMIINVTANNSMSFAFNNESGAAVADDQSFTASFVIL